MRPNLARTLLRIGGVFSLSAYLLLSGCAVIHFNNGTVVEEPEEGFSLSLYTLSFGLFGEEAEEPDYVQDRNSITRERRWYHHAIFQLAELSNPMETNEACRGREWNQITTEVTPFDGFVGLLDNLLLYNASAAGLDLWSPWSLEYTCRPVR